MPLLGMRVSQIADLLSTYCLPADYSSPFVLSSPWDSMAFSSLNGDVYGI